MTGSRQISLDAVADLDKRYVFHPFTQLNHHERNGGLMIVKGEGVWLTDAQDRRYIDAMAGLWCVNVGYGRREIAEAMRDQALRLPYYHAFSSMSTDKPALLAAEVIAHAPAGMSKVFFGNSGSDANDTQVKLVWYYNNARGLPAKKKIISRQRGYHGVTMVSASLTGLEGLHKGFSLPFDFVRHAAAPYRLWDKPVGMTDAAFSAKLADDLERQIVEEGPETVAAFIAEPIQGAGGVIVPPEGYFATIQAVLRKYDVLMIADEVICGFGRLGTWFGSDPFGIEPDLMTVAKGITSAYAPLSACIVSEKVWRVIADASEANGVFSHGFTYTAHPISAAAALANLALLRDDNLIEGSAIKGAQMQTSLARAFADHPLVGEVRGMGLIAAVEMVARKDPAIRFDPGLKVGSRIANAALKLGLITRALPQSDTIAFSPPLVISEEEIEIMVARARTAVDTVMDELVRDGVWRGV
jgi:L-2,4-diaminobutyrate transaminase